MELIDHKDLKDELFESEEVKEEYENLNGIYEIKRQIIRYRIENDLTQKELAASESESIGVTKRFSISATIF